MASVKENNRYRRARKIRGTIYSEGKYRLSVDRTLNHINAQIIDPNKQTVCSASTREGDVQKQCHENGIKHFGNIEAAKIIGQLIAERSLKQGIKELAFDRSGYKYHGRIEALANSARESGLEF